MATVTSFPPIAQHDATVLILGSMPGRESLARFQYYAHPRNAFWFIMDELFGTGTENAYAGRKRRLAECRVAVWDVLMQCYRPGSLDSNIRTESEIVNDFPKFFMAHLQIRAIFFNGKKAETIFRRHVIPRLVPLTGELDLISLPSTSPAHASLTWAEKLTQWKCILDFIG